MIALVFRLYATFGIGPLFDILAQLPAPFHITFLILPSSSSSFSSSHQTPWKWTTLNHRRSLHTINSPLSLPFQTKFIIPFMCTPGSGFTGRFRFKNYDGKEITSLLCGAYGNIKHIKQIRRNCRVNFSSYLLMIKK